MPSKNPKPASPGNDEDFYEDVVIKTKLGKDRIVRRRMLVLDGEKRSIVEWAKMLKTTKLTIMGRLKEGWSVRDALMKPVEPKAMRENIIRLSQGVNFTRKKPVPAHDVKDFMQQKMDLQNLAGIRELALSVKRRLRYLREDDQHRALAAEFGETKAQACRRLIAEERIQPFRTLVARYRKQLKKMELGRSILFYLALQEFPPPPPDDGI